MDLEGITKEFYLKSEKVFALKEFSYKFEKGKFYSVMGHSGSGKSTLINILGLLLTPTSGKYLLDGQDVSKLNDDLCSDIRMKKIGFIYQDYNLDENMTALENVMLPMLINKDIKNSERETRALKLLTQFGLEERLKHYPKEMSGGEKQRVAIARALANSPEYIICDEPTGNLDEENEKIVFNLLKELSQQGKTIIVVSHSDVVKQYSDVVIKINKGSIVNE